MRVPEGIRRLRTWRKLTGLVTASVVVGSIVGVNGVAGSDQRLAFVGSPPAPTIAPAPNSIGLLQFTRVTAGGASKIDYLVHSYDNQSLTHAFLDLPSKAFPQPDGLTVATVYGTDEGSCLWTVGGTSVTCDFQKLTPKKPDRSITVVWNVAPTFDVTVTPVFTASLQVNEQTNPNGTNQQVYQADSGTASVEPSGPDLVDTFIPPGQLTKQTVKTAGFDAGGGNLQTQITVPAKTSAAVRVQDQLDPNDGTAPFPCPPGLVCQSDYSTAFVNDGSMISPYLEWTLVTIVPSTYKLNQAFVAHYFDNGTLDVLLLNKQKDACTTTSKVPCATFTLSGNVLTIYARTKWNGGMRY